MKQSLMIHVLQELMTKPLVDSIWWMITVRPEEVLNSEEAVWKLDGKERVDVPKKVDVLKKVDVTVVGTKTTPRKVSLRKTATTEKPHFDPRVSN
jgi:hypothetical protein